MSEAKKHDTKPTKVVPNKWHWRISDALIVILAWFFFGFWIIILLLPNHLVEGFFVISILVATMLFLPKKHKIKKYIYLAVFIAIVLVAMNYVGVFRGSPVVADIRIDLGKSGNVYEKTIKIKEEAGYNFLLMFVFKDSQEDNGTDRAQLRDFLSYRDGSDKSEIKIDMIPIPVKLSVYELQKNSSQKLIANDTYKAERRVSSTSTDMSFEITDIKMTKGTYSVKFETLTDLPYLSSREVYLEIKRFRRK